MRKYLLATVSATIIALCSSGYADNTACTVAQMNTITDVNACQNFANNCGMDTFMANADISFGNFFTDFANTDESSGSCNQTTKQCTATFDAGCSYLAFSRDAAMWSNAKKLLLTPVVNAFNQSPTAPAPYSAATMTCTYACSQFNAAGQCTAIPPQNQWNCQAG
ncbi:MAG: hypothetical protein NTU49_06915 [Gammaproteobacteria bacterium]|nr:hypothetical protein [Gammaproteobacteria bacterium]